MGGRRPRRGLPFSLPRRRRSRGSFIALHPTCIALTVQKYGGSRLRDFNGGGVLHEEERTSIMARALYEVIRTCINDGAGTGDRRVGACAGVSRLPVLRWRL